MSTTRTIEVKATDQLLLLNTEGFRKGMEIKGFINFRGTPVDGSQSYEDWNSQEDWVISSYLIKGAFRATVH